MTNTTAMTANWNYPTSVRSGCGRINEIVDIIKALNVCSPLLVTDPGLSKLPMVDSLQKLCAQSGIVVGKFDSIKPNPTGTNVSDGAQSFMAGKHDCVIAFGGGSALDAGKSIALIARQSCELWALEDIGQNWKCADANLVVPVIAVPTTAGTGSEVGRAAVIVNEEQQRKVIIFHPNMIPDQVILDAELTQGLPANLTAATGMDALSHNLEAFFSPLYHPMAEGIALEGTRIIKETLETVVEDGRNLEARSKMLVASTMGATAFQRGLGAMHALAHPLGAIYDAHHGLLNAILMPYVLVANGEAIKNRVKKMTRYLNLSNGPHGLLDWILQLRANIGIPHDLSQIGLDLRCEENIGALAVADPSASTNPIKFDENQYRQIYMSALRGNL